MKPAAAEPSNARISIGPPFRNTCSELVPARPGCLAVRLPAGAAALPAAVRALDDAGVDVAGLDLAQPTLDDVFVAKTGRHLEAETAEGPAGAPAPSAA